MYAPEPPTEDFSRRYWRSAPDVPMLLPELDADTITDDQFRLLADNIPILCWIANGDGYIVWYNRRWHEYCGTTPEQMEGWGWQAVHDPTLLPRVMARWTASIATGEPFEMTFPLKGADGVYRPFLTRIQPVRDASGRVVRWFGVNTDISGQIAAETELARREAHLIAVFEQSAAGMSEVDGTGRFLRVNDRFCEITGRSREALLGLRMQDITHPEDLIGNAPIFQRSVETGESFEIVKRYIRPDGSVAWVHNSVTTLRAVDGRLLNTVCVTLDITDRKLAERRRDFLAGLAQRLQAQESAEAIQLATSEMLGREIGVARAGYGDIDPVGETVSVERDWTDGTAGSLAGVARLLDAFGAALGDELRAGRTLVVDDHLEDPRSGPRRARTWAAIGTRAFIVAPLMRAGQLRAILYLHESAPRRWTEAEVAIVEAAAEQSWSAVERARTERLLRESEARFRGVFASDLMGFSIFDAVTGETLAINDQLLAITDHSREDFEQGRWNWREFTPPEYLHLDEAAIEQVRRRGSWEPFEKEFRRRDGSRVPVRLLSAPLPGQPGRVLIGVEDISEARLATERLRESEARLRLAIDAGRMAVFDHDFATDELRHSAELNRLLGFPANQRLRMADVRSRYAPGEAGRLTAARDTALARRDRFVEIEFKMLDADRELRWLLLRAETRLGKDGTPVGSTGVLLDITERKRAEEQLREREAELNAALEAGALAMFEFDHIANNFKPSPRLNELYGYAPYHDLTIEDVRARYHPDGADEIHASRRAHEADPTVRSFDRTMPLLMPDGGKRWVQGRGEYLRDETGRVLMSRGVVMDVTERKKWEEHQRLLINELNHRAKNLLAIIQGIAQQTFKGSDHPPEARQAFEGRLGALSAAHNLLTRRNWESAPIRQLILDTVAAVSPAGHLDIDGPDLLLPPKTGVSLAMAVHELATNAIKYGALSVPEGKVHVRWEVDGDRLKLVWREHGGPRVEAPSRRGFGTRMIERGLAAELGGAVRIDFRPKGVVCEVDAPLPKAGA